MQGRVITQRNIGNNHMVTGISGNLRKVAMNGDSIDGAYLVLSACTFYIVGIMEQAMIILTTLSQWLQ